ncbi:MAG: hypothetical protein EOM18_13930, partial [Clostridia bacterium]|nr:hypothetical protein [Clostridia bacterium]
MEQKKWDVYVYGDVNIDIVIPGVEKFPLPGQEDEVDTMETFVGGGAALFTLGLGKLGLHPVFQGEVGDDCYGGLIRKQFTDHNVDDSLLKTSDTLKTGISLSFTNENALSCLYEVCTAYGVRYEFVLNEDEDSLYILNFYAEDVVYPETFSYEKQGGLYDL